MLRENMRQIQRSILMLSGKRWKIEKDRDECNFARKVSRFGRWIAKLTVMDGRNTSWTRKIRGSHTMWFVFNSRERRGCLTILLTPGLAMEEGDLRFGQCFQDNPHHWHFQSRVHMLWEEARGCEFRGTPGFGEGHGEGGIRSLRCWKRSAKPFSPPQGLIGNDLLSTPSTLI